MILDPLRTDHAGPVASGLVRVACAAGSIAFLGFVTACIPPVGTAVPANRPHREAVAAPPVPPGMSGCEMVSDLYDANRMCQLPDGRGTIDVRWDLSRSTPPSRGTTATSVDISLVIQLVRPEPLTVTIHPSAGGAPVVTHWISHNGCRTDGEPATVMYGKASGIYQLNLSYPPGGPRTAGVLEIHGTSFRAQVAFNEVTGAPVQIAVGPSTTAVQATVCTA